MTFDEWFDNEYMPNFAYLLTDDEIDIACDAARAAWEASRDNAIDQQVDLQPGECWAWEHGY